MGLSLAKRGIGCHGYIVLFRRFGALGGFRAGGLGMCSGGRSSWVDPIQDGLAISLLLVLPLSLGIHDKLPLFFCGLRAHPAYRIALETNLYKD
jgi:hypothetical protein